MKLVSWNVNGIRACVKKGFEDFFKEVDADIFCIQESKCQEGQVKLGIGFDAESRNMTFRFADSGVSFNPLEKQDPDITLSAEEREIGGLGILICKKTMDEICYSRENDENVLTMTKKI